MNRRAPLRAGLAALLVALLTAFSGLSHAECSETRIQRMAKNGKTVSSIASTCKMDKESVQEVLEETGGEDVEGGGGSLGRGAPVGQCGCWGYADPNHKQPHAQCRSGYARPSMCNFPCPAGGFAWQGVCT